MRRGCVNLIAGQTDDNAGDQMVPTVKHDEWQREPPEQSPQWDRDNFVWLTKSLGGEVEGACRGNNNDRRLRILSQIIKSLGTMAVVGNLPPLRHRNPGNCE